MWPFLLSTVVPRIKQGASLVTAVLVDLLFSGRPSALRVPPSIVHKMIAHHSIKKDQKGVSTKGVSMKRSNFLNLKAFYTVVSKRNYQKSP